MDFVGGQVWRVRPEDLIDLVPIGQMDFQVELRLLIAEFFPGFADLPGLLFRGVLRRTSADDGARLQRGRSAQNTVPQIVGSHYRQANRFAAFLGHGERLRKQMLFDAAEKLVRFQLVFAGPGTPQQPHVEDHDVATPGFDAVQNIPEVIKIEVVADRYKNVAGTRAHRLGTQLSLQFEIELIHFDVRHAAMFGAPFGNGEDHIQDRGKDAAGHGGNGFREQVHHRDQKQRQGDETEAHGNLYAAYMQVERNL